MQKYLTARNTANIKCVYDIIIATRNTRTVISHTIYADQKEPMTRITISSNISFTLSLHCLKHVSSVAIRLALSIAERSTKLR